MEFKLGDRAREAPDSQAGREAVNAGAERKLTAGRDPSVGSRGDGRSEPSGEQAGCDRSPELNCDLCETSRYARSLEHGTFSIFFVLACLIEENAISPVGISSQRGAQ
ncbi:hypothetical protein JEQ12_008621 [Ovis aries]|uniref:Uncharacterized protein n=1 Tax=Ovis aries TaxID=9940 RepID=A0A836CT01_SHEEP|nr:hypothetical protein JEQ12_008621 [Ovis aries]